MKRTARLFLLVLLLLGLAAGPASAQSYLFQVTRQIVNLYINENGTGTLEYVWEFQNDPDGAAIEYVDFGLPSGDYNLDSVQATVNGQPITDITRADPENLADGGIGVTLGLGANAIRPGDQGAVRAVVGTLGSLVFQGEDAERPDYASVQFAPSYFGSRFVQGQTDMEISIHLPPGVKPDEGVYYPAEGGWPGSSAPEPALDDQGRVTYTWFSQEADASERYLFGAGFPASYVPAGAIAKEPPPFTSDGGSSGSDDGIVGLLVVVGMMCLGGLIFGGTIIAAVASANKRKLAYLPPKIAIEGNGIKRGLTAPEAAILMEQPLDKVLTMILFGLIKKNAVRVTKKDPMEIEPIANAGPLELAEYEKDFIAAFRETSAKNRRKELQTVVVGLVRSLQEKMRGFSRKETIAYYKSIVEKAWQQVESAATPEVKSKSFDEGLEWTMMDQRFPQRTQETFRTGPVFVPTWWYRYDPVYTGGGFGGTSPASTSGTSGPSGQQGGGGSFSLPNLPGADFAASVVNGVQGFGASVLGDLSSFTGGVTNTTNPIPQSTYTRGGGGGRSGGCACACACAGCACACAGGGR